MIEVLVCDDVRLTLQRLEARDYRALTRRGHGIAAMSQVTLSETVASLNEDNEHSAMHEVVFVENFLCQLSDIFDPITSRETA
jgi:hypothetical protein